MRSKPLIKKISKIIHLWDPIGYTPTNEYDDLALQLYSKYCKEDITQPIADYLREYLRTHIGLTVIDEIQLVKTADLIQQEIKAFQE